MVPPPQGPAPNFARGNDGAGSVHGGWSAASSMIAPPGLRYFGPPQAHADGRFRSSPSNLQDRGDNYDKGHNGYGRRRNHIMTKNQIYVTAHALEYQT